MDDNFIDTNDTNEPLDDYETLRLLFNSILGPTVSILGIIGNILCLLAIWYRNHKVGKNTSTSSGQESRSLHGMSGYMYIFIRALACADLCYLFSNLLACYFGSKADLSSEFYAKQIIQPTWNAFKATSDFIVISMTIDRCRMIGDIAQVKLQSLRKEAEKAKNWVAYCQLLGILLFSFVFHTPFFVKDFNYEKLDNETEHSKEDDHPSSVDDLWVIYHVIYAATVKCLPVIIVVTLNILLIKRLRVVWRRRKRFLEKNQQLTITPAAITLRGEELNRTRRTNWSVTSKTSIREQRLALLLVSVAVSFVLFTLPANVAFLWYEFGHIDTTKSETLTPLFITTNFMESINYSINFYIYCAVHEEIRHSFIDLCNAAWSKITFWRKSQDPTTTH